MGGLFDGVSRCERRRPSGADSVRWNSVLEVGSEGLVGGMVSSRGTWMSA